MTRPLHILVSFFMVIDESKDIFYLSASSTTSRADPTEILRASSEVTHIVHCAGNVKMNLSPEEEFCPELLLVASPAQF